MMKRHWNILYSHTKFISDIKRHSRCLRQNFKGGQPTWNEECWHWVSLLRRLKEQAFPFRAPWLELAPLKPGDRFSSKKNLGSEDPHDHQLVQHYCVSEIYPFNYMEAMTRRRQPHAQIKSFTTSARASFDGFKRYRGPLPIQTTTVVVEGYGIAFRKLSQPSWSI